MSTVDTSAIAIKERMTLPEVARLLALGEEALQKSSSAVFDLSAVSDVDSSALAIIFAWQRKAKSQGGNISISNLPKGLTSLAEVYGVRDLLPVA